MDQCVCRDECMHLGINRQLSVCGQAWRVNINSPWKCFWLYHKSSTMAWSWYYKPIDFIVIQGFVTFYDGNSLEKQKKIFSSHVLVLSKASKAQSDKVWRKWIDGKQHLINRQSKVSKLEIRNIESKSQMFYLFIVPLCSWDYSLQLPPDMNEIQWGIWHNMWNDWAAVYHMDYSLHSLPAINQMLKQLQCHAFNLLDFIHFLTFPYIPMGTSAKELNNPLHPAPFRTPKHYLQDSKIFFVSQIRSTKTLYCSFHY